MLVCVFVLAGVLFWLQSKISKSIISPDSVYMYWMGTICFGTVILCRQYEYNMIAILWMTASMVLFTGFAYLGGRINISFLKSARLYICIFEKRKWLFWVIYFCVIVAGLSYSIQMLHNNGFSVMKITNMNYCSIVK